MKLVYFETLDQFSLSSFEIRGFSSFNQILLGLFDVLYAFQDCICVVYNVWNIFILMLSQILLWNAFEMSNKRNKIWLKKLNPHISRNKLLNWFKVSKWTNSKIYWKLRVKNIFNHFFNTFIIIFMVFFPPSTFFKAFISKTKKQSLFRDI